MRKLFLICLLVLVLPLAACAEIHVEEGYAPNGNIAWKSYAYSGERLPVIRQALDENGFPNARFLTGASIEDFDEENPGCIRAHHALLAVETEDGRHLLGVTLTDDRPWRVEDFGTDFLMDGNFAIGLHDQPDHRQPLFCMAYSGLHCYHFQYQGSRWWRITGYHDAAGTVIETTAGELVVTDEQGRTAFCAADGYWPEYMTALSEYPTSRSDAQEIDKAETARTQEQISAGMLTIRNANLRTEPTGNSQSLGLVDDAAIAIDLGDRAEGARRPWYHVRLGHVEGWVDSHYAQGIPGVPASPLRVGRMIGDGSLLERPDGAVRDSIAAGTVFHVLAATEDGWLLVSVPSGEFGWEMDPDGQTGYVHESETVCGATLNAVR